MKNRISSPQAKIESRPGLDHQAPPRSYIAPKVAMPMPYRLCNEQSRKMMPKNPSLLA